jgi:hypothetical protein
LGFCEEDEMPKGVYPRKNGKTKAKKAAARKPAAKRGATNAFALGAAMSRLTAAIEKNNELLEKQLAKADQAQAQAKAALAAIGGGGLGQMFGSLGSLFGNGETHEDTCPDEPHGHTLTGEVVYLKDDPKTPPAAAEMPLTPEEVDRMADEAEIIAIDRASGVEQGNGNLMHPDADEPPPAMPSLLG